MEENQNMIDALWTNYEVLNDQIQFSDAKAGAILAAQGILIGFLIPGIQETPTEFWSEHPLSLVFQIVGLAMNFITAFYCLWCLSPTLKVKNATSLIFFMKAAEFDHPHAYADALEKAFDDERGSLEQIAAQLWASSRVAAKKYKLMAWATRFFMIGSVASIIGAILGLL
jgi:hypothetical protein